MIICIDVGNTHIYGGVFDDSALKLRFRYPSTTPCTSDTLGIFLQEYLLRHDVDIKAIKAIIICSVVPNLDYTITSACIKYFNITPIELKAGIKTGIKLAIKNPLELGADRVANAVAATHHFPDRNLIVVDFGTATTLCAIAADKTYIGGAILPGVQLSMQSLSEKAAKLSNSQIIKPETALGKCTLSQLHSGIIFGQLGAIKEITQRISETSFKDDAPIIMATGGYAQLFEDENYFNIIIPDLVLHGLRLIWEKNQL